MSEKLITVIIPVYNTEKYLERCINSVISQTYANLEIIIVNDGSTDNSLSIIDQYEKKDSRIKVINKKNGGLSSARNAGLKCAKGDYILHVDSDDWIDVEMCNELIESSIINDADITICDVYLEYNNKTKIRHEPYLNVEDGNSFVEKYVFNSGLNSVWNKLIKKEVYTKTNILHYEDISLGEDSSALIRLIPNARKISYINKPFYHYNLKSNGMSRGLKKNIYQYLTGLDRCESYYKDNDFDTSFFPFFRLKIGYSELIHCSLKKAEKMTFDDYSKVAKRFLSDYNVLQNEKKLSKKYKLFVKIYYIYALSIIK